MKDVQGITCRELLDRCGRDDGDGRLYVLRVDDSSKRDLWDGMPWNCIKTALDEHAGEKVWFVNFHG